jgi:hypothetical protein
MDTTTVSDVVEHEDGSATLHLEMDKDTSDAMIRVGLRNLFSKADVFILPPAEYAALVASSNMIAKPVTYELSAQEAQLLLDIGFNSTLTKLVEQECSNE